MSVGKSVRMFLADGTLGGLLTAEIMNWTGHVVAAPRSDLAALLKRPEISRTGVYILLGDDPEGMGGQMAYIGEGDDVRWSRLYQHARSEPDGKDFWNRAIVMTSKDANLTKAHARYLESRLISLALLAKRTKLANSTSPPPIALPEADASDTEYFIDQARIMLPVLGVNIFRSPTTSVPSSHISSAPSPDTESPTFELTHKRGGIVATAREVDGEFTVLEGSAARPQWIGVESGYTALRKKLEQDGTLIPSVSSQTWEFSRSQVFSSPSAAAAVVLGRNANGRIEWAVQRGGLSYGDWQNQGVEEAIQGVEPTS